MIAYADTSFLISLYGQDANSPAAVAVVKRKPTFFLTPLIEAEFVNAIELCVFRKHWNRREAWATLGDFRHDQGVGVFRTEPLSPEIWQTALALSRRLTARMGVRTLDLLHVATVKVLKPDVFYTFDQRQRRLAKAERLHIMPT